MRKSIRSPFGLAFLSGGTLGRVMAQRLGIDETNPKILTFLRWDVGIVWFLHWNSIGESSGPMDIGTFGAHTGRVIAIDETN